MSDYVATRGRIGELIAERTEAAFREAIALLRPHGPSPEVRERLEAMTRPVPVQWPAEHNEPAPTVEESQL